MALSTCSAWQAKLTWPTGWGTSGRYKIISDREFVFGGKVYPAGRVNDPIDQNWCALGTISVSGGVPTFTAFTLPQTDTGITGINNSGEPRFTLVYYAASGGKKGQLFSNWRIGASLTDSFNFESLAIYNASISVINPRTDFLGTDAINNLITARLYAPSSTTQLGLSKSSWPPADSASPVHIENTDPRLAVFNVQTYGAIGDNSANDVAAFRLTVAAVNAAGGGIIDIPPGTYKLSVGNVTSDTNYTLVSGVYALLPITASNVTIRSAPNAIIRVVATWISQHASSPTTATPQSLFYLGSSPSSPITNFNLIGSKITWEAASPAVLLETQNGSNDFGVFAGALYGAVIRDITLDGFPRGAPALGGQTISGEVFNNALWDNMSVLNYGGTADDSLWYVQGRTTLRNCRFVSTRTYQSHAIYWGADRPYLRVEGCYFQGIASSSAYALHLYGSGGTLQYGAWIDKNVFVNCNVAYIRHPNIAQRIHITNNKVYWNNAATNTGFIIISGNQFEIDNNEFFSIGQAFALSGQRSSIIKNTTIHNGVTAIGANANINSSYGLIVDGVVADNITGIGVEMQGTTDSSISSVVMLNAGGASVAVQLDGATARVSIDHVRMAGAAGFAGVYSAGSTIDQIQISDCYFDVPSFSVNISSGTNISVSDSVLRSGTFNLSSGMTGPSTIKNNQFGASTTTVLSCPNTTLLNNSIPNGIGNLAGIVRGQNNLIGTALDADAPAYAAAYTPNAGVYRSVIVGTLTGGITINAPTNPYTGAEMEFIFAQDGTGARVVTWNAAFKLNWTPDTAAGKVNSILFRYNGTSWVQSASATGL